jgi:hypothetical protein
MTMRLIPGEDVRADGQGPCTLVVADWKADPQAVLAACARQAGDSPVALLVPATLHGIDWVGDPYASVPCARLALSEMSSVLRTANLRVQSADLRDPNSVAAVLDLVLTRPVERILVCEASRHWRPKLIDLAHRARRATGLPVVHVAVAARGSARSRAPWLRLWRGECPAPRSASVLTRAVPV